MEEEKLLMKSLKTAYVKRVLFSIIAMPDRRSQSCYSQRWDRPEDVKQLKQNIYCETRKSRKEATIEIFDDAKFKHHKQSSNVSIIEISKGICQIDRFCGKDVVFCGNCTVEKTMPSVVNEDWKGRRKR